MIIDIRFNQGAATWNQLLEAVCAAESAGFSTAWIVDHLSGSVMNAPSMLETGTQESWQMLRLRCRRSHAVGSLLISALPDHQPENKDKAA